MRINLLMLLMLVLFITGCTIRTTGNVVIEDAVDQSTGDIIIEDVTEEEVVVEEQEPTEIEEQEEGATEEQEAAESEEQEAEVTETTTTEETEQPEETTTTPEIVGKLISIENLKFVPETLTISKGETVTWKHNDKYLDNMKHRVRIYPMGDASPMMYYGDVFSYTFNEPGEYNFMDIIYKESNVRGKIIVE